MVPRHKIALPRRPPRFADPRRAGQICQKAFHEEPISCVQAEIRLASTRSTASGMRPHPHATNSQHEDVSIAAKEATLNHMQLPATRHNRVCGYFGRKELFFQRLSPSQLPSSDHFLACVFHLHLSLRALSTVRAFHSTPPLCSTRHLGPSLFAPLYAHELTALCLLFSVCVQA